MPKARLFKTRPWGRCRTHRWLGRQRRSSTSRRWISKLINKRYLTRLELTIPNKWKTDRRSREALLLDQLDPCPLPFRWICRSTPRSTWASSLTECRRCSKIEALHRTSRTCSHFTWTACSLRAISLTWSLSWSILPSRTSTGICRRYSRSAITPGERA